MKNYVMIALAVITISSIMYLTPNLMTSDKIDENRAYARTVGADIEFSYTLSQDLVCNTYVLPGGGEGIFGTVHFDISGEAVPVGLANTLDLRIVITPHDNAGTHLAPRIMTLIDDLPVDPLVGNQLFETSWALPSHDDDDGHAGQFLLQFVDNTNTVTSIVVPYPSCTQSNTAAP